MQLVFGFFILLTQYMFGEAYEEVDIYKFLQKTGYPMESYPVTTDDNYILTMQRIPHGRNSSNEEGRPPVFLMHGAMCSSMEWVVLGPGKALALILADAGYDVWLGNHRGSTGSQKHMYMNPDRDPSFWNYSYHEIGIYDLPAMIDFVLKKTTKEKLTYVGYSQGFTSFAVMGSLRPEYNDKILLMNAFAPVTDMYETKSFIFGFLKTFPSMLNLIRALRVTHLMPHSRFFSFILTVLCNKYNFLGKYACAATLHLIGFSYYQLDKDFMSTMFNNFPTGISIKQIEHYTQGARSGVFREFDYGPENPKHYNRSTDPPVYNLTKVTAPIIMYYGQDDYFVNNVRLQTVAKQLPNVIEKFMVPYLNFNHLDFVFGKNISLLNDHALQNINKYNQI